MSPTRIRFRSASFSRRRIHFEEVVQKRLTPNNKIRLWMARGKLNIWFGKMLMFTMKQTQKRS